VHVIKSVFSVHFWHFDQHWSYLPDMSSEMFGSEKKTMLPVVIGSARHIVSATMMLMCKICLQFVTIFLKL